MTAARHIRAAMDAALVVAVLLALIALVRGGRAYGLMVASAGVSVWLASVIFDQLQVRAGQARLANKHGQTLDVPSDSRPRDEPVERPVLALVLPTQSRGPLSVADDWADSPATGWRMGGR